MSYKPFCCQPVIVENEEVTTTDLLLLEPYTVATLPISDAYTIAVVSDSLAPNYNATVVGGGTVKTIVMYDGANWKCH